MGISHAGLNDLLATAITRLGYEFVGYELIPSRHTRLCIYIDKPQGVTLEDCQVVSRQVSSLLDVENPIAQKYSLEVSSPGLDRPLYSLEHYRRFKGQKIHVKLHAPLAHGQQEDRRNFSGIIEEVNEDVIYLKLEHGIIPIPFSAIAKANLIPVFK